MQPNQRQPSEGSESLSFYNLFLDNTETEANHAIAQSKRRPRVKKKVKKKTEKAPKCVHQPSTHIKNKEYQKGLSPGRSVIIFKQGQCHDASRSSIALNIKDTVYRNVGVNRR